MTTRLPQGYSLRPMTLDDAGAVTDLINDVTRAEIGVPWTTLEETRDDLSDPGRDPDADLLLVDQDGIVRAYLHIHVDELPATGVFNLVYVHPERWGRGLSAFMLRLGEERALARFDRVSAGSVQVQVARFVQVDAARALFETLGYRCVRTFWEMKIDLDQESPMREDPAGITIRTFELERDLDPVYEALAEAFADHWGNVFPSLERWRHRAIDGEGADFDPGLWFVALEGDHVVGAATCRASSGSDAGSAVVEHLGVRGAWRRRGIALALLHTAFRVFRDRGIARAELGVDADSTTGATQLYERAGMRVAFSWEFWEKELRVAARTS